MWYVDIGVQNKNTILVNITDTSQFQVSSLNQSSLMNSQVLIIRDKSQTGPTIKIVCRVESAHNSPHHVNMP